MTGREFLQKMEALCPLSMAAEWDNPGFLIGDPDREITKIALALDATGEVIEEAVRKGANLIVTHHPMLFHPMKQISTQMHLGKRAIKMLENKISLIALHTNFDICVMAELAADKLELKNRQVLEPEGLFGGKEEGFGRFGMLEAPMTLKELAQFTKERFDLPFVIVNGEENAVVQKVAVATGSGKSGLENCAKNGVQVLITGDVDHHSAVDALEMGVYTIDAGHFGTEKMFADYMVSYLSEQMPEIEAYKAEMKAPFRVI